MKLLFSILIVQLIAVTIYAQKAISRLDTNIVLIGDYSGLSIKVTVPVGSHLQWHGLDSVYAGMEVLNQSKVDTVFINGEIVYSQKIILIPFDSGFYALHPISFPIKQQLGQPWDTLKTNALALKVETMAIDTTQAIKSIKPPLNIPWHWKDALPFTGIALAILLLAAILFHLLKRKKKVEVVEKIEDRRLPHEIALEKLMILEGKELWQKGNTKNYYINLTYIVREYIEKRFETDALESTTDEIIQSLKGVHVKNTLKERIRNLLNWADLVKFAKANPSNEMHLEALKTAQKFIQRTAMRREVGKE